MPIQNQSAPTQKSISLDGTWDFQHLGDKGWRKANVPQPWQAEFVDLRHVSGKAVYKRGFRVPADWAGLDIHLQFGSIYAQAATR